MRSYGPARDRAGVRDTTTGRFSNHAKRCPAALNASTIGIVAVAQPGVSEPGIETGQRLSPGRLLAPGDIGPEPGEQGVGLVRGTEVRVVEKLPAVSDVNPFGHNTPPSVRSQRD